MTKKKRIVLVLCLLLASFVFSGCFKDPGKEPYALNLEIWGVFDDGGAYEEAIRNYREINPFVKEIKYRKFDIKSYKRDLINSMAAGTGPDIFFIQNTWLPEFIDKVVPAPNWLIREQEFRSNFVDVVIDDFFSNGVVYGVPLSVDSLALYYNKDIFNAAGIALPPTTWDEVEKIVQKITKIDAFGNITQQGIALGTADNINRPVDLLSLLMLQRGLISTSKQAKEISLRDASPALNYYLQFSRIDSPLYSWNPRMHNSIDAFVEGTLGMMLNYSWQYGNIKSRNAKLNFAVTRAPQFKDAQPVNYANYWVMVVAKNKPVSSGQNQALANEVRTVEAWEFIKFLTFNHKGKFTIFHAKDLLSCLAMKKKNCYTDNAREKSIGIDPAASYIVATSKPAARRDLLQNQMDDPVLGPFAYGNLIAKSWYQPEADAVEVILSDAINSVNNGNASVDSALMLASERINRLRR